MCVALILGAMQIVGAASGGNDPLQPLAHLARGATARRVAQRCRSAFPDACAASPNSIALLRSPGRPVMLDFYADWCVSCKEMERFTFTDPVVAATRCRGALLLKADVTANNADDRALLKRFGCSAHRARSSSTRRVARSPALRVVGFQNAERFAATLNTVGL